MTSTAIKTTSNDNHDVNGRLPRCHYSDNFFPQKHNNVLIDVCLMAYDLQQSIVCLQLLLINFYCTENRRYTLMCGWISKILFLCEKKTLSIPSPPLSLDQHSAPKYWRTGYAVGRTTYLYIAAVVVIEIGKKKLFRKPKLFTDAPQPVSI